MECPICGTSVGSDELVCPICGYEFGDADRKNNAAEMETVRTAEDSFAKAELVDSQTEHPAYQQEREDGVEDIGDISHKVDNRSISGKIILFLGIVILVILVAGWIIFVSRNKKSEIPSIEDELITDEAVMEQEQDGEVEIDNNSLEAEMRQEDYELEVDTVAFYGIWCASSVNKDVMVTIAEKLASEGFSPKIVNTIYWENLNNEELYAVTAGVYDSESAANADLERVGELYADSYVGYTGAFLPEGKSDAGESVDNPIEDLIVLAYERLLTDADLPGLTSFELSAVRNGIYAYAGYVFTNETWIEYFSDNFDWYRPNPNVKMEDISTLANKNAGMIRAYEIERYGGIYEFTSGTATFDESHIAYFDCSSRLIWNDYEYPAEYVRDYMIETAWQEGVEGNGEGEFVSVVFDDLYEIGGMEIHNGYQKSEQLYYENSRPKRILLEFSNGKTQTYTLEDIFGSQVILFDEPVNTSYITITILSVYEGTTYQDTGISEVRFLE